MKGRHFSKDAARDEENQEEGPGSDPVPKDGVISFDKSSEDSGKVMNSISEGASKGRKFGHDAARDEENQEEGPGSDPVPKDGVISNETIESASASIENVAEAATPNVKQALPGN